MPASHDFFISYNRADRGWAEWIAWQLEDAGYTAFLQAWDFRPGGNWALDMQTGARAERTLAVLSPDYLDALYTQPEWAAAFAQDPTGERGTHLPVRVRDCELRGLHKPIIYIDLVGVENEAAARDALLAGVKRERAKPKTAPNFPGAAPRTIAQKPRFPGAGALPPIWNVPHRRNPNFTGREALLESLSAALASEQAAALTQAITGLGGVGKTQLAIEYAYRHTEDYEIVWWIGAEEPSALAAAYAGLAVPLDLPEKDAPDQSAVVEAVRRWLEQSERWLLVFDNAVAPEVVRPYLPRSGDGHILITSRNPDWRGDTRTLPVHPWNPEEAVRFLRERTDQADESAARALAEALGYLPLALEQAAAYIGRTGRTTAAYLDLFRKRQLALFQRTMPPADYHATVATTWELAFEEAGKTPLAAELLNLLAFFGPDSIPRELLESWDGASDELAFDDAVAALRRFSLVEVADNALSAHRLVQAVTRERLTDADRKSWAEAAARLVDSIFPEDSDDVRTWPECARLLPHAVAAADHAEALGIAPEEAGEILNQVGLYLWGRAEYAEAKVALERALKIDEATYGPDHPNVAIDVNNLGTVLQDLGDLAGAKAALERALKIDEAVYGLEHPTVAIEVNNLGRVLRASGNLAGARAAFERALKIHEATYGPNHPTVAIDVNNLGGALRGLGDLAGARAAFERALKIQEAAYGPNHPNVAIDVNNLGTVLQDLGDLAGARTALERALKIDEAAYGPEHPTVAIRVNNLGRVLQDLGELASARTAYEWALVIFRRFLGDEHPRTRDARGNLESVEAQPSSPFPLPQAEEG